LSNEHPTEEDIMQFHLNGFRVGDPVIEPVAENVHGPEMPDQVDVLIAGSGPAGLVLAAQLSKFPDITTRIVERRAGPLLMGQADGVACRTVEMFNAFGLAERLLREAYWVNETVFWRPGADDHRAIRRTGRVQDTESGLSEFPHVIVNQARIQDYLLDVMRLSPRRLEPDYDLEVVAVERDNVGDYPVRVTLRRTDARRLGEEISVRARYVVGCDGARSRVRTAIGQTLRGDAANHAWGVMDALAVTNFPDIRLKAAIQSAHEGNLLIIPREGGHLVRFYVDLGDVTPENRDAIKQIAADHIIATAQRILHPYTLDVKEVAWFSVYEVGQRLTDRFDDSVDSNGCKRAPRVFIAGDACHTHSAKAGQRMNVSMQDGFNLSWKLAAVLRESCHPDLLHTYSRERQPIARELIEFDKEWSAMMAAPPKDPSRPEAGGVDPAELQAYFVRAGRYTAGLPRVIVRTCSQGNRHIRRSLKASRSEHGSIPHPCTPCRCQADAPRTCCIGGRPLAPIRFRRRRTQRIQYAVRVPDEFAGFRFAASHAQGREPGQRARCARSAAASPSRTTTRRTPRPAASTQRALGTRRLRESIYERRGD
jgi:phenol 2-monooxygenase